MSKGGHTTNLLLLQKSGALRQRNLDSLISCDHHHTKSHSNDNNIIILEHPSNLNIINWSQFFYREHAALAEAFKVSHSNFASLCVNFSPFVFLFVCVRFKSQSLLWLFPPTLPDFRVGEPDLDYTDISLFSLLVLSTPNQRADVDGCGKLTVEAYKKIIRDHSLGWDVAT